MQSSSWGLLGERPLVVVGGPTCVMFHLTFDWTASKFISVWIINQFRCNPRVSESPMNIKLGVLIDRAQPEPSPVPALFGLGLGLLF